MKPVYLLAFLCALFPGAELDGGDRYPGQTWLQYAAPEEAGFSTRGLAEAKAFWESIPSAAVMVIRDGAVVAAWGEVDRRFMCHGLRTSFMSALYGLRADEGSIDIRKKLSALQLHDQKPLLTEKEKEARIVDLLCARSGIYLPAAYEPPEHPKPTRGSHAPGTYWCYNNWDINVLCTILEQETGTGFFEALYSGIASPLEMEDFRIRDGYYHLEPEKSPFPAYPMRMSARDLARFGLLYLKRGAWKGRQILSEEWVRESTRPHSEKTRWGGFGYLWWIPDEEPFRSLEMISTVGLGEQSIDVLPQADLVFVLRTNTFTPRRVSREERYTLLRKILDAGKGEPVPQPKLVPLPPVQRKWKALALTEAQRQSYCGDFIYASGDPCHIFLDQDELLLKTPTGDMTLIPIRENRFLLDDYFQEVCFEATGDEAVWMIFTEMDLNRAGYAYLMSGDQRRAMEIFEKAVHYFPSSYNVYDSLGEAYMVAGKWDLARENYRKSIQLNPENSNGIEMLHKIDMLQEQPVKIPFFVSPEP